MITNHLRDDLRRDRLLDFLRDKKERKILGENMGYILMDFNTIRLNMDICSIDVDCFL